MENKELNDNKEHKLNFKNRFAEDRKAITKRLLLILDITNDNKKFESLTLDKNKDIQQEILNLVPEIRKFFTVAKFACLRKDGKKLDKPYLSLTRSLLKDMDIIVFPSNNKYKVDNKFVSSTSYTITSDISEFLN